MNNYRDFTPVNSNFNQISLDERFQQFNWNENPGTTFEATLPLIFEDSLLEYIKTLFIKLSGHNIQIPWMYIIQNSTLINKDNTYNDLSFDKEWSLNKKF